jgi:predicted nucleic acid-binding protein
LIVIDASALTDVLLGRPEATNGLKRLLSDEGQQALHAPELVELETLSALRGLVNRGEISVRRATEAVTDLAQARMTRYPHGPFRRRIWELRDELTAYDASYLALAEALDATLFTADAGLAARARRLLGVSQVLQPS